MRQEPLTAPEAELLRALVEGERPLASLHGPPDVLEPALVALLREGYVDLVGQTGPLDPSDAERLLFGARSERPPDLHIRVTEAGRSAWEAAGIAAEKEFAELEREARHLRGF